MCLATAGVNLSLHNLDNGSLALDVDSQPLPPEIGTLMASPRSPGICRQLICLICPTDYGQLVHSRLVANLVGVS